MASEAQQRATGNFKKRYPDKIAAYSRKSKLKTKYGLTPEEAVLLLESQGGRCAICLKLLKWPSKNAQIDHDHRTGKVRGILCMRCNRSIGAFEDSPRLLRFAADYLERVQEE